MKLKLLALAVVAATTLPASFVFADGHAHGPVVYGKISVSLDLVNEDTIGIAPAVTEGRNVWNVIDNSSRIGIKGEEDLGKITALYQWEAAIAVTDGAGIAKNRDSFLGLKGDFGTIMAGQLDTPFKKGQGNIDLFNDSQLDITNIIGGEERLTSVLAYKSNAFNGIHFFGALQPGEGGEDNESEPTDGIADAMSMSIKFESDNLFLSFSADLNTPWSFYEKHVDPILGTNLADNSRTDAFRLAGLYTYNNIGFGALYQTAEQADVATPLEQTAFVLSGYVNVDQTTFKVRYAMSEHELGAVSGMDFSQTTFGVDQSINTKTTVYAAYQIRDLDRGGFVASNLAKIDTSYFSVGAMYQF